MAGLLKGEWSCCRGGQCNVREWLCYRGGQCNGGIMVMLLRWPVEGRENCHVTEVVTLIEGECSFLSNLTIIKQRYLPTVSSFPVSSELPEGQERCPHCIWKENGHVTDVVSLIEGQ